MGEAKRKARHQAGRSWAEGKISVIANGVHAFDWSGTREDAIVLQKQYLAAADILSHNPQSFAKRAAGYLMTFGAPKVGEPRLMPTGFGEKWEADDVEINRIAVLWLVLREHVPNTGQKVEDVFAGQHLGAIFSGDRDAMLEYTEREQRGLRSPEEQFQMMVAVAREPYLLNPDQAVGINEGDMYRLAKGSCPEGLGHDTIYVPRIPRDAAEANAMMETFTILGDATTWSVGSKPVTKLYAGYSEAELLRGKPGVAVGR